MAKKLRNETTITLEWIAARQAMGAAGRVEPVAGSGPAAGYAAQLLREVKGKEYAVMWD